MVASHFHLPQKQQRKSTRTPSSDWRITAILVLLVVQVGFMGWWYWTEHRPIKPASLIQSQQETTSPQEPAVQQVSDSQERPATNTEPSAPPRDFSENPVRVQVLNGCGVRGMASRFAECMRSKGFDVRETGNADRYDYEKSRVIGRVDDTQLPKNVADVLGLVDFTLDPNPALVDVEVTVIVGEDHSRLRCP